MAQLLKISKTAPMVKKNPDKSGFTLLEVMVAMAILSIALTGVYRLQSQTMAMSGKARFYSLAPLLAQDKLSQIERTDLADIGNSTGEFGTEYPGYTWSLDTAQVTTELLENTPYNLLMIELTIVLNDEERYALRTYRFHEE